MARRLRTVCTVISGSRTWSQPQLTLFCGNAAHRSGPGAGQTDLATGAADVELQHGSRRRRADQAADALDRIAADDVDVGAALVNGGRRRSRGRIA